MTAGRSVDWFPHPSPCGRHVVYLAYPEGTAGHPGGLDVALRLMPQTGGASREVVRLHGGQGTINVPSWAPDGGAFAFVRYGA
jgi:Tol biopolymer transport system component